MTDFGILAYSQNLKMASLMFEILVGGILSVPSQVTCLQRHSRENYDGLSSLP